MIENDSSSIIPEDGALHPSLGSDVYRREPCSSYRAEPIVMRCAQDAAAWRRALAMVRRFTSAAHGATAIEFAMIMAPFMMLLGVVLETGLITLSQQSFDVALERAARQLRTGAFQDAADGSEPRARLQTVLCHHAITLFGCSDLRLELASTSTMTVPLPTDPFDKSSKTWNANFGTRFDCPKGADIVMLRAAVPVPRLLWFLDFTGRVMPDGRQLLVSTRIFQSENYDQKSCE